MKVGLGISWCKVMLEVCRNVMKFRRGLGSERPDLAESGVIVMHKPSPLHRELDGHPGKHGGEVPAGRGSLCED